jgi:hypothetical protein
MPARLRSHIAGNAIGYVALFVALGGTSYGVATGFIDSREIRNNTIRTQDLRNNEVRSRDIRNRTIIGRDLLSNTLGGAQVNESRLGEVPSAATAADASALGGLPASNFGRAPAATVDLSDETGGTVLEMSGLGTLAVPAAGCETEASPEVRLEYRNTSGASQDVFAFLPNAATELVHDVVGAGATAPQSVLSGTLGYAQLRARQHGAGARQATIIVFTTIGGDAGNLCRVSAQALSSG